MPRKYVPGSTFIVYDADKLIRDGARQLAEPGESTSATLRRLVAEQLAALPRPAGVVAEPAPAAGDGGEVAA